MLTNIIIPPTSKYIENVEDVRKWIDSFLEWFLRYHEELKSLNIEIEEAKILLSALNAEISILHLDVQNAHASNDMPKKIGDL